MRKSHELMINIYIAAYVVLLMLFCIGSSPLVKLTATDSSVFITMGRGMLSGKIMYKDLFDHKGLYMYFLNFLGALSGRSLMGLFIVETVFMFACAMIVYALFSMYASQKVSFAGMQIFLLFALRHGNMEGGNLTEEYTLVFQLFSVYLVARYLNSGRTAHPAPYMFLHGIAAGIVLFLRPNMIMMWGAVAILVGVDLLGHKDFRGFLRNLAAGLLGMLAGTAPVILYLVVNDAVKDAVFAVFTYNTIYTASGTGLLKFIQRVVMTLTDKRQTVLIASVFVSAVIMFMKRRTPYFYAMLFMCVISVSLSGRRFGHYYMQFIPFCLPLAYEAAYELNLLAESPLSMLNSKIIVFALLCVTLITGKMTGLITGSRALLGFMPAVKTGMGQFVRHNEPYYSGDEKVLVTGNMSELYNDLGVIPHERYFYTPSMTEIGSGDKFFGAFPEAIGAQTASIISGVNDVIFITEKGRKEIFSDSGRGDEAREVLDSMYTLLYYDEEKDIAMYGRKR